jgi:hypothetical protein
MTVAQVPTVDSLAHCGNQSQDGRGDQSPLDTVYQVLQTVFGFTEFRAGQLQVISRLLVGRSALAMPPSGTRAPDRSIIRSAIEARARHSELREEPSVLAKFLCGIRSPRTTRAGLTSHELFGTCRTVPFQSVVNAVRQEGGSRFPQGF